MPEKIHDEIYRKMSNDSGHMDMLGQKCGMDLQEKCRGGNLIIFDRDEKDEKESLDVDGLVNCPEKLVPVGDEVKENSSIRCEQNPNEVAELKQHSPILIGAVQTGPIPVIDEKTLFKGIPFPLVSLFKKR